MEFKCCVKISSLFTGCASLKELPDISNWNISNVNKILGLFAGCSSLKKLPDISKWNKVILIICLFYFVNAHL